MTQQLDTSADADVIERDNGMTEDIQQTMADSISAMFDRTLEQLIALRDSRYSAGIEELEQESNRVSEEYGQLEADIAGLEAVLPSKERLTQHEVDELLLSGAKQDAANRRAELAEFTRKPVLLRQRQKEITPKLEAIASEKEAITRTVFEDWLRVVRTVVMAGERGLLIVLLEGLSNDMYKFQERVGMTRLDNRTRPLVNQSHFSNLTADGRSPEWAAGHKWYG